MEVFERTKALSQQKKFEVLNAGREDPRDMSYEALKRRIAIRARVFENNERYSASRVLDLTDKSQHLAQTMHLGKTIDDIPHGR